MKFSLTVLLNLAAVIFFSFLPVSAEIITLSDAENSALNYSKKLKSAISEQKSYEDRALVLKTQLYPKLFLDGSYKHIASVQEIALPVPGFPPVKLGDNTNYSLGPQATWTLLDFGATINTFKAAYAVAQAKQSEADAAKNNVLLSVRLAYFYVCLAEEQMALYTDALKLANTQYDDIRLNVRAGTKSLTDELKSHQEVISKMKQLRQSKSELALANKSLSALMGREFEEAVPDKIDSLIEKFEIFLKSKLNTQHPGIMIYQKYAEASKYSKQAASSIRWPRVQLSARSSIEYPNGAKLEAYNQTVLGAALNWPLFESGASTRRLDEYESASKAGFQRAEQALSDLKSERDKTIIELENLYDQKKLNDISISETERISEILYSSYKAGSLSYIEIENANFKALEAKIQAARTKVQILINLAILASMSQ